MDWSKTKNILIIALIATNIFLMFTYFTKNQEVKQNGTQDIILSVLENKNIFVDNKIPQKYEKMPAINIEYSKVKRDLVEKNIRTSNYDVSEKPIDEEYKKVADSFLRDSKISTDNLKFKTVMLEDNVAMVRYQSNYKGVAIADRYLDVHFIDGKITDVTKEVIIPTPQSKRKLNIISPEEALLVFMSEKSGAETVHVENIEPVFWVNDTSFDGEALLSDTAFPAWQITYNGGKITYIDAYKT
ncbi:MAG: two-component system regulatory protein YycI [Aminipila sp.]